jgi:D-serine deaminase-like pyridoxal phosphate-dependent protein
MPDDSLAHLPTPAVLIDEAQLHRNIAAMQARADQASVAFRPHAKTHKSLGIAQLQQTAGARGLTVAKPSEAIVFARGGFHDLRLAYTIIGADKHQRLAELRADGVQVSFCVDSLYGIAAAGPIYEAAGQQVEVLIEVDAGYGRAGVRYDDHETLAALAGALATSKGLRLVGLLTHGGHGYRPGQDDAGRHHYQIAAREEQSRLLEVANYLHGLGHADPRNFEISVGSTPTSFAIQDAKKSDGRTPHTESDRPTPAMQPHDVASDTFRITEFRAGNYVFFDQTQIDIGVVSRDDVAMTVLATVVSTRNRPDGTQSAYLDAGKKVLTSDRAPIHPGYGVILQSGSRKPMDKVEITGLSEEHAWVHCSGTERLSVGQRVEIIPNHACVVAATQDVLYRIEDQRVLGTWEVTAKGMT